MIIKATEKAIPTIQQLARKSWDAAYAAMLEKKQIDYMLGKMYSTEVLQAQLKNPNFHYFLVIENGIEMGFIGFENHYEEETTKLHRIYFLPEAKGKGLGKEAIQFVKVKTRKAGDRKIILTVNKNNKALFFYQSQGFKIYSEAIFDIGNGYVMDDFLMEFLIKCPI